jgi:TonB family protein
LAALSVAACRAERSGTRPAVAADPPADESQPPVMLNAVSPAEYPGRLLERQVGGTTTLALWIDETGRVVPESTRVAEPSGWPAFDRAALDAAPALRFAPALDHGRPVAAAVLQPVEFSPPTSNRE